MKKDMSKKLIGAAVCFVFAGAILFSCHERDTEMKAVSASSGKTAGTISSEITGTTEEIKSKKADAIAETAETTATESKNKAGAAAEDNADDSMDAGNNGSSGNAGKSIAVKQDTDPDLLFEITDPAGDSMDVSENIDPSGLCLHQWKQVYVSTAEGRYLQKTCVICGYSDGNSRFMPTGTEITAADENADNSGCVSDSPAKRTMEIKDTENADTNETAENNDADKTEASDGTEDAQQSADAVMTEETIATEAETACTEKSDGDCTVCSTEETAHAEEEVVSHLEDRMEVCYVEGTQEK